MTSPLKAAVIGASGIGKQHAKWLCSLGLDVTAFAGSSPESTEKTARVLAPLFGFQGKAYWDVEEMLTAESPDIVVVSSPPELHKEHTIAALESRAHVICEKPMVWRAAPMADLREDAREMARAAQSTQKLLTVNTQYVALVDCLREIRQDVDGASLALPERVFVEMESKGGGGAHEYEEIFHDLAPHPISFLLAAAPNAKIDEGSIDCELRRKETVIELTCTREDGGACHARFELRNISDGNPSRRFGIDDCIVGYEGRNDDQGRFRAYLCHNDQEYVFDDFVQTAMQRLASAVAGDGEPLVSLDAALAGFDLQLQLYDGRRRVHS